MKKVVKATIWGWYQACLNVVIPNGSIESPCHQTTLKNEGVMLNQWTTWVSIC
jgi:hypothetical protein